MSVTESTIEVEPMGPVLGARVHGVDLAQPISDEVADDIRRAFLRYHVLCFPKQKIDPTDQARFAALFGSPDSAVKNRAVQNEGRNRARGVMYITNIRENGKPIGALPDGEMHFHSDGAHRSVPYRATTLYAVKIPSRGGETRFADMAAAYDALSDDMKARIDKVKAVYVHDVFATMREQINDSDLSNISYAEHSLVRPHPETGRKGLYLSRLMTRFIVGMDRAESDQLLDELLAHAEKPEFIYEHKWEVGDLIIWDNRCLNHARADFPGEETRLMRRVTVSEPGDAGRPDY